MQCVDGVVLASPHVNEEVEKLVRESGKPLLEYQDPESAECFDNYHRFYDAL
jgi:hypothetical protein